MQTALLSSPIIAIYGVIPVYVFNNLPAEFLLFGCIALTINVFIFWLINIAVIKKTEQYQRWKQFAASYFFTALTHFAFLGLRVGMEKIKPLQLDLSLVGKGFLVYPIISMFAINTIILIICNSISLAQKKELAEFEVQRLKVNSLEAQQKVLMQQLQPHFLFNTLSVLKSLIQQNPEEAETYVIRLSQFLRYTIEVNNTALVPLGNELQFTRDYIDLQKVRFENSLLCTFDVPDRELGKMLPAYALQALVENAIKHNAFTDRKPLRIAVSFENNGIQVCNNKSTAKAHNSSGTGLANLNARYQLMAGKMITIQEDNNRYCVFVPLLNQNQL